MPETLALMFMEKVQKNPDIVMQYSKQGGDTFIPTTYRELLEEVGTFAAGLKEMGIERGDRIGLISDNRKEWLMSDLAIIGLGAADVPRGCDATEQEIAYILSWSDCKVTILENDKQLEKILARRAEMPGLNTAILYDAPTAALATQAEAAGIKILKFTDVFALGKTRRAAKPGEYEAEAAKGTLDEIATIIYTSGTTGEPKGVMLTNGNFLHQTSKLPELLVTSPGQIWLSVLPVWHSFERILQYTIIELSNSMAYSKPIGAVMLPDFQTIKPHWMASVPRIWESVKDGIYRNIRQTGGAKKALFIFFVGVG
ncbi:MAG: AMP-binding protein, partial [Spirochaetota bacterium]